MLVHTQARPPAGDIARRAGSFVSAAPEKAGDKAGDALKGQEHPQRSKRWINEGNNLWLPGKEGALGSGWPTVLSGVLGTRGDPRCHPQFGELDLMMGDSPALLFWEAAGTKRRINPSLLIKVMLTCARAQAVSRGRINRRDAVLAHQNPTPVTASAQMAPLICAS